MSIFRKKNIGHIEHWKIVTKPIFHTVECFAVRHMQLSAYVAKQVGKKIGLKPILSLDE
jgi:hypothetical protein